MPPELDVLIAGAGFSGTALALALCESGLKVGLLDARGPLPPGGSTDARGLVMVPSSRRLLAHLGIWRDLVPYAAPIRHVHVSDRGHFGFTRFAADELGVPELGHVCPADRLATALESALLTTSATLHWSTRVGAVRPDDEGVSVDVAGPAGAATLRAKLLVGADGASSPVRESSGIGTTRRDYGQTAIVANLDVSRPAAATAFERFTPDGPIAILPLADRRVVTVCTVKTADAEAVRAHDDAAYLEYLQERFGNRLGRFSKLGVRGAFPLGLVRAERVVAPRTVLAGNAANAIHPNGAQGLNLGLRDVAVLAEMIADAHAAGADPGAPALLDAYAKRRRAQQRSVVLFSDSLARVFKSDFAPLVGGRNAFMLALDLLPGVKRTLGRRLMGLSRLDSRLMAGDER
ncbi:MAG: FAD-dependent monooxygenase [Gammaproteobacteria bacterium]|nr:FAD-dependent monooxygenase [Gammaproteobacteria bacterium]